MSRYKRLMNEAELVDVLEIEGFGKGPFRLVRNYESWHSPCQGVPAKPGSTCDRCGQAIARVFVVANADGHEHKLGCDCIRKVGLKKLHSEALAVERAARREAAWKKRAERERAGHADTCEWLDANPEAGNGEPHPNSFLAAQGKTMRDYWEWLRHEISCRGKFIAVVAKYRAAATAS